MKLLSWLRESSPAQRLVASHAQVLRSLEIDDLQHLAFLLEQNDFEGAAKGVWEVDQTSRTALPQGTWHFLLSLGFASSD
jgi:hypothetical protein